MLYVLAQRHCFATYGAIRILHIRLKDFKVSLFVINKINAFIIIIINIIIIIIIMKGIL
jgi:hypothetical protein